MQYPRTAELVRQFRRSHHLSQREFAALAGTSGPTVAAYETGAKEPRLSTLDRLASAVGEVVEIRRLMADQGARQRRRRELRSLAVAAAVAAAVDRDLGRARALARANLDRASVSTGAACSRWIE